MTKTIASPDGRYDVLAAACPTRQIVARLGDKWTLLVVFALSRQPYRFRELQRAVEGISQRMLAQTLRNLERDGLVDRDVRATVPPQVTYSLTPMGTSLSGVIAKVRLWAYANVADVEASRARFDTRREGAAPSTRSSARG